MQVDKQKRPLIVLPENSNTALASVLETTPPPRDPYATEVFHDNSRTII